MKTNIHIRLNGKIATVLSMGKSYICSKGNPQSLKEQRLWFQRKVQEKISTLLLLAERNLLPATPEMISDFDNRTLQEFAAYV
ncbi:hypothetical protein BHM03_00012094 [Ensete ventricosum]|nr:hypothetical protein BHM03_00012094 [Ensete ventricosum]